LLPIEVELLHELSDSLESNTRFRVNNEETRIKMARALQKVLVKEPIPFSNSQENIKKLEESEKVNLSKHNAKYQKWLKEVSRNAQSANESKLLEFICRSAARSHHSGQIKCTHSDVPFWKKSENKRGYAIPNIRTILDHSHTCPMVEMRDLAGLVIKGGIMIERLLDFIDEYDNVDLHYQETDDSKIWQLNNTTASALLGQHVHHYYGWKVEYH